jgi:serine phosphatase RsbU (regulator of sigma subunit)
VSAGELRFANAGHPSPFRLQRDANEIHALKEYDPRHGPALGLFEKTDYPTCRCPFARGDFVFLFTDGIYEVTNADGEEYGQERLLRAVRNRIQNTPEELFQGLLAETQEHSGSREFEDDVCLVGVEAAATRAG